ncbi:MAG: hypothetical protein ABIA21_02745 [Candidatus Aenigmatarchaeota archaeon]
MTGHEEMIEMRCSCGEIHHINRGVLEEIQDAAERFYAAQKRLLDLTGQRNGTYISAMGKISCNIDHYLAGTGD